ncbi:MAG TPA: epoxyqueuosine reductase QueH [Thermoplasmata archaeon]|nr:epoxyqueuosine reductase QueH [Thermoplasmata archaeon]
MSRVLIHACCAPCLTAPLESLEGEGHEVEALWYNPNVHPYQEYLRRMHEVQRLSALRPVAVHYIDEYPLREWLSTAISTMDDGGPRCQACYRHRLQRTARFAAERGFDAFTTTLLVSRHQDHEGIRSAGEEAADRHGVPFLYRDLRRVWRRSIEISRELRLYRQPYCGCIFSEYDRFGPDE